MEQKKRKLPGMLLQVLCWACILWGGFRLASGIWVNVLYLVLRSGVTFSSRRAYSIGVIGGADGPTAVFLTAPVWTGYLIAAAVLAVGIGGLVYLRRKK